MTVRVCAGLREDGMRVYSDVRYFARLACNHPALIRWWLRNRIRETTLALDQRRTDGLSRYPRGVTFKLTLACNLRCKMCAFAVSGDVRANPRDVLPVEAWKSVVDDIAIFRPYVSITGGEPTLYPQLVDLLAYIRERRLVTTLTTNGTLLGKQAEAIMQSPPDVLIVSIDGPEDVHDELRGMPGSFQRAIEGIRRVQSLKAHLRRKEPFVVVSCAITSYSYRAIEALTDIASDLGADAVNYQHQWSLTRQMVEEHNRRFGDAHPISYDAAGGIELPPVDTGELIRVLARTRQRRVGLNGTYLTMHPSLTDDDVARWYSNPNAWVKRKTPACAWLNTDILPNGDVEPCPGLVCGNITREKFTEIWNNEAFRNHRRRLVKSGGGFPICRRCCSYFRRD